jgi:hypothetical protein
MVRPGIRRAPVVLAAGAILAASLAAPAQAAQTGITLETPKGASNTLAGHSFTAYRIGGYTDVVKTNGRVASFDVATADQGATKAWLAAALKSAGLTVKAGCDEAGTIAGTDDAATLRRVADLLATSASKPAATVSNVTGSGTRATLNVPDGYYLVTDTNKDTLPMIVGTKVGGMDLSTGTLGTLTVKTRTFTLDKTLVHVDGSESKTGSVRVGDTATYHIAFTMPYMVGADASVRIVDQMTGQTFKDMTGVTLDGRDVTDQVGVVKAPATAIPAKSSGLPATTLPAGSVGFNLDRLATAANGGKRVVITVRATITSTADNHHIEAPTGHVAWKDLSTGTVYTPDPPTSRADVYTGDLKVTKTSTADRTARIPDAGFKIRDKGTGKWLSWSASGWSDAADEAHATEFRTGDANHDGKVTAAEASASAKGDATFPGLSSGTYEIRETTAPEGFVKSNLGLPSLTATLDAEKGTVTYQGADLPNLTTVEGGRAVVADMTNLTQLPTTGGVWGVITAVSVMAAFAGLAFGIRRATRASDGVAA